MPRKPNPMEEMAQRLVDRLMEEHLFPMMDQMFASIHPSASVKGKRKRMIRVHYVPGPNPPHWIPNDADWTRGQPNRQPRQLAPTHYDTLQVSRLADHETIQAAWKSLCVRFHPDKNPGDGRAAERMVKINQAWEVLGDPRKRAAYDRTL